MSMIDHDDVRQLKRIFVKRSQHLKMQQDIRSIKEQLKTFATKSDLIDAKNELRGEMKQGFEQVEQKLRLEIKYSEERMIQRMDSMHSSIIKELHDMIDPFVGEVVASREERVIMGYRLANHTDRIEHLEKVSRIDSTN